MQYAPIHGHVGRQPLRRSRGFHTWENQLNVSVQEVLSLSLPISVNHPHHVFLSARGKKKKKKKKESASPWKKRREKKKSATLLFQLLSVTAYRTRSRIPLGQQREDKGRASVEKETCARVTNCVVIVNSIVEKLCKFFLSKEDSCWKRFVLNKTLFDYCHSKRIFLLLSHTWWQVGKRVFPVAFAARVWYIQLLFHR